MIRGPREKASGKRPGERKPPAAHVKGKTEDQLTTPFCEGRG